MSIELPTRQRILDTALDLFGTRGVDGVSLDEIARDVGVRKQTVLYWFPSKDELVDAVLETVAAELVVVIDAAVRSSSEDPLDRVDAVVRAVFRPAVRRPAETRGPGARQRCGWGMGARIRTAPRCRTRPRGGGEWRPNPPAGPVGAAVLRQRHLSPTAG